VPHLIQSQSEFTELLASLHECNEYAIDTEFHREKTYYPQLALMQVAWNDQVVLVDPFEVDLSPMADLFQTEILCIMHAGSQDLEILMNSCGTCPSNFFDTQIAAGFLGLSSSSLNSLLDKYLQVQAPKADRLTDWLQRPLSDKQIIYAASDVEYLIELKSLLVTELSKLDRTSWAEEESALLRQKYSVSKKSPLDILAKIREGRHLKGEKRKIAVALASWREERAAKLDVPVRHVLPDLAIVTISQKTPRNKSALKGIRALDSRYLRAEVAEEIIAAVQSGIESEDLPEIVKTLELSKSMRPAITLISSWLSQLARNNRLDPALLATRSDIESILKKDPANRLNHGWRSDLAGSQIEDLLNGRASIAFDSEYGLVLEERT